MSARQFRTAPARGYSVIKDGDKRTPTNDVIFHGYQPDGLYLNVIDLDTTTPGIHKTPGQNAAAARQSLADRFPSIDAKIDWHPTKHDGLHGYIRTNGPMRSGRLFDADGRHIGELLGSDTDISIPPLNLQPGRLSPADRELLFKFWHVDAPAAGGERWSDRAKEGMRLTAGWQREHITLAQLRTFLKTHCGPIGARLDALFDTRQPFDRSNEAGRLAQNILLHIHKIAPAAGYRERCALAMAYWMAADSFGKAGDKDYNQEKDGASLIAQIVNGDAYGPRDNPRYWTVPFWAKAHPTPIATPEPRAAPPARPAHRPAGDKAKQIARFKRILAQRWQDDPDRIYYFADDLDDWAARCGVKRRTIQSYLTDLEGAEQIARGQEGGRGGRPWMRILPAFFGMQITPESPQKTAQSWDANECATISIETPQEADRTPQAIEVVDHQDLSAPVSAAPTLNQVVERDAEALAECWAAAGPPRKPRRHRQSRFTGRDRQQIASRFARQSSGAVPTPSPYRDRPRLVEETLPELGAAAPAGAQGFGDLPTAPAGASPPVSSAAIARLKQLRDQRAIGGAL